jgi:ribosomal protein S18 acetylase RimI-like enzyme
MDSLVKLGISDCGWGGPMLGRAFLNDPLLSYVIPQPESRQTQVPWFVQVSMAYGCMFGEAYGTKEKDGVIFWLRPGETALTLGKMFKSGMLAAPFKLGFSGFIRFMKMADFTDKIHKKHAPMPHYYLFGMGVDPSSQGKGVGKKLIDPLIEKLNKENAVCYLETQNENNTRFYSKFGFTVVASEVMPGGDLRSWGMLRK